MNSPIKKWHEVVATQDHELLKSILSENVIFYSPVVFTPQKGRDITYLYLMAAAQVFNNKSFNYTKEIVNKKLSKKPNHGTTNSLRLLTKADGLQVEDNASINPNSIGGW